jgi:mono/diheme cytochrome c family protein
VKDFAATDKKKMGMRHNPGPISRTRFGITHILAHVLTGVSLVFLLRTVIKLSAETRGIELQIQEPTFTRDIAPIIFQHCSGCHRPGQPAPFALLTWGDAKKHAADIANVVRRRFMPPWLPEPGYGIFENEQRLKSEEIDLIERWVHAGTPEGDTSKLSPLPTWDDHWQLGKPDLVLRMPQPYTLAAEGRDEYRNFVIPADVGHSRYVNGVEFRPANPKIVHHAFVKVDRTQQSRRLDQKDPQIGFPGIITPAEIPDGHFLGWQPGRVPSFVPEGLAWRLDPGNDIILQMHLRRSGKPETVQGEIALFFTDQIPTNTSFRLQLASLALDIPAGKSDYIVEDSFTIPIDTRALAILPHAHYLAREMRAWATLPEGRIEPLIYIKDWDFEWHADYRYKTPIFLPAGTRVAMRFSYDNSTNNPRNPNDPPRRVLYGPQATDEMAQLFLQIVPVRKEELPILKRETQLKMKQLMYDRFADRLKKNPDDAEALVEMSLILLSQRKTAEAREHVVSALRVKPESPAAHYQMGLVFRQENQRSAAQREFEITLQLDPNQSKAYGNLGAIFLETRQFARARHYFEAALRLNPDDELALEGLTKLPASVPTTGQK